MRLILAVWEALRLSSRPLTKRELVHETGLDRDGVRHGLEALDRRGVLIAETEPRKGGTYGLVPCPKPTDQRGGKRPALAQHRAARPAVHVVVTVKRPKRVLIGATRRKAHGVSAAEDAAALLTQLMRKR